MISALVILLAADGSAPGSLGPITAETVGRYAPDPEDARSVMAEFERLGFTIGPLVGNSFSIAARQDRFEQVFGGKVSQTGEGLRFSAAGGDGRELPLEALPAGIRGLVHAAVFPEPPDFGPSDY